MNKPREKASNKSISEPCVKKYGYQIIDGKEFINGKEIILCPHCHAKIREDLICSDVTKCPRKIGISIGKTIKNEKQNKPIIQKSKNKIRAIFYPDNRHIIKDPDGSKGWHNIRDHGQFGSFPSFEPMDDE